ncbi:hypothetical protein CVD25_01120 [Bacillus canaveralius]|uniref:Uncharacterized protein n=1 Tax=Bacillus canaveralius TaxID=1403243 RepID=A0A2N5GPM6_9BACI|nr:hypothetical protein [Bacillus canaveralius]PLR84665.1 hypothetical protein CU635_06230 [Bacillus canaveralius]PLS00817.1 hypothetical protein CVD25_01120 [Bacillus canaveralius]
MAINEAEINERYRRQVENDIAQQRQSINNSLGMQKREFDNTINRNNQYLGEQVSRLNTDRLVNDDRTTALHNRRGGFYSGGLDYSLTENLRNTTSAQDNVRRDINDKNQGILGQYNLLASQGAEQISTLERQAPDRIRELVAQELARLREFEMEQERLRMQQEAHALDMQRQQLALSNARQPKGGATTAARTTAAAQPAPAAQQFRQQQAAGAQTPLDRYYSQQSATLNKGRSLAMRPIEDILPGIIPAPGKNRNMTPWQKMRMF